MWGETQNGGQWSTKCSVDDHFRRAAASQDSIAPNRAGKAAVGVWKGQRSGEGM